MLTSVSATNSPFWQALAAQSQALAARTASDPFFSAVAEYALPGVDAHVGVVREYDVGPAECVRLFVAGIGHSVVIDPAVQQLHGNLAAASIRCLCFPLFLLPAFHIASLGYFDLSPVVAPASGPSVTGTSATGIPPVNASAGGPVNVNVGGPVIVPAGGSSVAAAPAANPPAANPAAANPAVAYQAASAQGWAGNLPSARRPGHANLPLLREHVNFLNIHMSNHHHWPKLRVGSAKLFNTEFPYTCLSLRFLQDFYQWSPHCEESRKKGRTMQPYRRLTDAEERRIDEVLGAGFVITEAVARQLRREFNVEWTGAQMAGLMNAAVEAEIVATGNGGVVWESFRGGTKGRREEALAVLNAHQYSYQQRL